MRDLERMAAALAHRGPDGRKFVADGPIGLGQCLMQVNQEDLFEAQPLYDRETEVTLVADCRIDNRDELAGAFGLSAADVGGMPDSAFILRAYRKWGESAAEHLLGDFAFAVWDGRARKLILSRDHMGQRTLHYHRGNDFLAFATEIKALWTHPDVPRALNETELGRYILGDFDLSGGATLFSGVAGLVGGSTMMIGQNGSLNTRRYWEPHAGTEHIGRDEAYYVETYARVFAEAVACRVRRLAVPAALSLSGGFDSAAIAGLAAAHLNGRKLIAVASVMEEGYRGPAHDARPWVDVCKRAMPHLDVQYYVRGSETIFTGMEQALAGDDGICSIGRHVIDGLYSQAVAAGARLMLDGLGGDGALNPRGGGHLAYLLRTGRVRTFAREFRALWRMSGTAALGRLRADLQSAFTPLWLRWLVRDARRGFAPRWSESFIAPGLAKTLEAEGLLKTDRLLSSPPVSPRRKSEWGRPLRNLAAMAMPHHTAAAARRQLDLTRPLIDKRVVEFGLAVPELFSVKHGRNRHLARTALADVLPKEFQDRGRRQDHLMPDGGAMFADAVERLKAETADLADDETLSRYVDFGKLQRTLDGKPHARLDLEPTLVLRAFQAVRYAAWFNRRNQ